MIQSQNEKKENEKNLKIPLKYRTNERMDEWRRELSINEPNQDSIICIFALDMPYRIGERNN